VEGDPGREILRAARETGADLIVMGTHGRTGLTRLLTGSVAEKVLRKAPCPVLTVKTAVPKKTPAPAVPVDEPAEGRPIAADQAGRRVRHRAAAAGSRG